MSNKYVGRENSLGFLNLSMAVFLNFFLFAESFKLNNVSGTPKQAKKIWGTPSEKKNVKCLKTTWKVSI